jgi:hypothetical protein
MKLHRLLEANDDLLKTIRQECAPFLNAIRHNPTGFLYRGISRNVRNGMKSGNILDIPVMYGVEQTKADRQPRDSTNKLHVAWDEFFLKQFGWRARTDHVLFASSEKQMCVGYGTQVVITMPKGNFEFIWSPNVADMWGDCTSEWAEEDVLKMKDYRNDDLHAAIKSGHEVMIRCESAYVIACNRDYQIQLADLFEVGDDNI